MTDLEYSDWNSTDELSYVKTREILELKELESGLIWFKAKQMTNKSGQLYRDKMDGIVFPESEFIYITFNHVRSCLQIDDYKEVYNTKIGYIRMDSDRLIYERDEKRTHIDKLCDKYEGRDYKVIRQLCPDENTELCSKIKDKVFSWDW